MIPRKWRAQILQMIANASARVSEIAASAAAGGASIWELGGRAGGLDGEEGDDEQTYQDEGKLYQQYGLRSRPGPGALAVHVPLGGATSQRVILATEAPGTGPVAQKDWEVELYARMGQRVMLLENGSLELRVTAGGKAVLSGMLLDCTDDVQAWHYRVKGQAPTVATTNPQVQLVSITRGKDSAFVLKIKVAGGPASGPLCQVTFSGAMPAVPIVVWAPRLGKPELTYEETTSTITFSATSLAVGEYEIAVQCLVPAP